MRGLFRAIATLLALASIPGAAAAKLRVAASITDLASIAASVGGDQIEVFSVARPTADAHRVEVLPSYMVQVSRADLYLKVGLGLDQWADGIIDGSRNGRLQVIDCSRDITPLEKLTTVNAAMGDVHPFGNPHYWLDPRNGAILARTIASELSRLDPDHADDYRARAEAFAAEAEAAYAGDRKIAASLSAPTIFTYHASWTYFASAFGLEVAGTAEPVPGIPPTGKHLQRLVEIANARKVALLLQEPYFSDDAGKFLARETGLRVVKVAPSCDRPAAGSYLEHIQAVLRLMAGGEGATGGE
jgi:ABC-type Zn uptake system ZnuABC Zn-binding protein ZnuA